MPSEDESMPIPLIPDMPDIPDIDMIAMLVSGAQRPGANGDD